MPAKLKILFLCTGNSCRSQMAEGWARALKGTVIEPYSAGIESHGLNPHAVAVMREAGIDISGHSCQLVAAYAAVEFDAVVTVCGHADEHCPLFVGSPKVVHVGFDDPPRLAARIGAGSDVLAPYRRVRDEIRDFVAALPGSLDLAPRSD